jgi:ubiquinone/menaquinone biosynthesis C-methylase UbiE
MWTAVKRLIPSSVKRAVRGYQETKQRERLFGDLAPLIPPVAGMFDGPAGLTEFKANGEEFLAIYRELGGLQPSEAMLDVGSGIGRKTWALTQYLNDRAVYEGIDIVKAGVDWCRERITSRYPNFRFQQIDVYNGEYNPAGTCKPSEYRFPFPDGSFQFVTLGSVFTHMAPVDVEHYLSEVARVLAPGGRCLISYFLLNDESLALMREGRSAVDFHVVLDGYRAISAEVPERAIALDEERIRAMYQRLGMTITRMEYGSWCGRTKYRSYQDLVLAVKKQP